MSAFVTAGGGFLLAVLWFDLMFDVQVLAHRERELPDQTLASIAAYYARVTTAARPMNRLVATVMMLALTRAYLISRPTLGALLSPVTARSVSACAASSARCTSAR